MSKENVGYEHPVPIAGKQIIVLRDDIDIDKIDLDPENPRIGYYTDNRTQKKLSQEEISFALKEKTDDINRLKLNIEAHEGIMNPIWVHKKGGKYSVIDGNTRLEIYRELKRKYPNKEIYKKISCEILSEDIDEESKNFIRLMQHLRGANDWEVYERARMLYILWEERGYTEEDLESQTKLSKSQIRRWREAYKNMSEQFLPKYKSQGGALSKFSYFVEFENPKIKQGMEDAELSIDNFCEWVGTGEIKRAQDVRDLKKIFEDKKAIEKLVRNGYKNAIEELNISKPGFSSVLFEAVESVLEGLENMTMIEEEEIIEGDNMQKRILLTKLHSRLGKITKKFKK